MNNIFEKIKEVQKLEKEANNKAIQIFENGKDNEVEIERDGKKIKLKEKYLWEEVRLEAQTNAKEELIKLYPEEMELIQKYRDENARLNLMLMKEWGINPEVMSFTMLITLIEKVYENKQRKTRKTA